MAVPNPLIQLIDQELSDEQRRAALRAFAREEGWHPSDEILHYRRTSTIANGHLIVEHGLNNTAVISFLRSSVSFNSLPFADSQELIALSYNNLVDWHLFPDRGGLLTVFNRTKPLKTHYVSLVDNPNAHRAESFDKVVGRKPTPNLPALDDALISTVAKWRRLLASELSLTENTNPLAELFNGIFFVRALEDDHRRAGKPIAQTLAERVGGTTHITLGTAIREAIDQLTQQVPPQGLVAFDALAEFDQLHVATAIELVSDFYANRFAPYEYDFSLMSKHALTRIYEKYISILRPSHSKQRALFAGVNDVDEQQRRGLGEIYTPQYIARFFSRFLRDNTTPKEFRSLLTLDPACGSGMFLRTLLETQCDPTRGIDDPSLVQQTFENVRGVDVEENACKATRLSLSLLHLVLTGTFPTNPLKVEQANAIDWFLANEGLRGSLDSVIANPPYVRWEDIPLHWQPQVREFLGSYAVGRPDLYLAFLKLAFDAIRPGGFLLFVLPHAFLIAESAKTLRNQLGRECWIRHLVDLSKLNVFEDASSYPVLLIAQRKRQPILFTTISILAEWVS